MGAQQHTSEDCARVRNMLHPSCTTPSLHRCASDTNLYHPPPRISSARCRNRFLLSDEAPKGVLLQQDSSVCFIFNCYFHPSTSSTTTRQCPCRLPVRADCPLLRRREQTNLYQLYINIHSREDCCCYHAHTLVRGHRIELSVSNWGARRGPRKKIAITITPLLVEDLVD